MVVSYQVDLVLRLDDDESADKLRRDMEHYLDRDWVKEPGDSARVKIKSIDN